MPVPWFNRLDRYLLTETLRPFAAVAVVALLALLLERLLRLFRLVTEGGGPLDLVAAMAVDLVPHYLGLALPAALFLAVYLVMGRLGADSELDAMRGCGLPLARAARSFLLLGLAVGLLMVALVGWLQPLGRYSYRAMAHAVTQGVWDGSLPAGAVVEAGDGLLISADRVEGGGTRLGGVLVRQALADGTVLVTSAASGRLTLAQDRQHMRVLLEDGAQLVLYPDRPARSVAFSGLEDIVSVRVVPTAFRPRGAEERELTLPELARAVLGGGHGAIPPHRLSSEFHARLVRAASVPLLPLLAVGVGLTPKRRQRGLGLLVGMAALFVYHHLVLTGEGMADNGRASPLLVLWGPFAGFALGAALIFLRLDRRPGDPLWPRRVRMAAP